MKKGVNGHYGAASKSEELHFPSADQADAGIINMNRSPKKEQAVAVACMFLALSLLGTYLAGPEFVWGQQVTAAITGKVTDPSNAGITRAKVMAKDIARGVVWT